MAQQRKQVTILFLQFHGVAQLAETSGGMRWFNALWEQLYTIILDRGGVANPPMADTTLAVFGAPTAHEDDPERATRASLLMQEQLRTFNSKNDQDISLSICINTGPVLFNTMGIDGRFMAVGQAINHAGALLRAHPAPILLSSETYRFVRGIFSVTNTPPLTLPGIKEAEPAYILLREKPRAFRRHSWGIEGSETRMIGRYQETHQLREVTQTMLQDQKTQIATISGENGIGKSRLLDEFETWIDLLPSRVYYIKGQSDQDKQSVAYGLLRNLFFFRHQILSSDSAAEARKKLEAGIQTLMAEFAPEKAEETAHFIGQLIGIDFSDSPHLKEFLHDLTQFREKAWQIVHFWFTAASHYRDGCIMLIEDIHWADLESLKLLSSIGEMQPDLSLLIVTTTRPSLFNRVAWGKELPNYTQLDLAKLSNEESTQLARELLHKIPEPPEKLLTFVTTHADSNPFYIEELVKKLIIDNVIIVKEPDWEVVINELDKVHVPETLTGILQARLDNLNDSEKEILQQASVIGRQFWDGCVIYIGLEKEKNLAEKQYRQLQVRAALQQLQRKDLIAKQADPSENKHTLYFFKQNMMHEVTYDTILLGQRRNYHLRVAKWLIEDGGETNNPHSNIIASHFRSGGKLEKAATWMEQAGQQAQTARALETAVHYYRETIEILIELRQIGRTLPLHQKIGKCFQYLGDLVEAEIAFNKMLSTAEEMSDALSQANALGYLSDIYDSMANYEESLEYALKAEAMVRWLPNVSEIQLIDPLFRQGFLHFRLGNLEKAEEIGLDIMRMSRESFSQEYITKSHRLLGTVYNMMGRNHLSIHHQEKAIRLSRELGDNRSLGRLLNNLGETARQMGNYDRAIELYEEALETFRELGERSAVPIQLNNIGGTLVALKKYTKAIEYLTQALDLVDERWLTVSETRRFLAEAYLGVADIDQAIVEAQQALQLATESKGVEDMGNAWRALGMAAAAINSPLPTVQDADERFSAEQCFQKSIDIFTQSGMERDLAWTQLIWANAAFDAQDEEKGSTLWRAARDRFDRMDMMHQLERMDAERPPSR